MKREEAIINAGLCESFLAIYHKEAFLTKDIEPHNVSVHFFDMTLDKEQVKKVAKKMDTLRRAESDLVFREIENLNVLTFTIYWNYE